jgi:hypothetical protein
MSKNHAVPIQLPNASEHAVEDAQAFCRKTIEGLPLFPWCFPVRFQDGVNECHRRHQLKARPLHLLPRFRYCASDRFPHHSPMHTQLLGNPGNRPDAELVLAPDLFEQLHFPSPVQRVPPPWAAPKLEYPSVCLGWAKTKFRSGPLHGSPANSVQL